MAATVATAAAIAHGESHAGKNLNPLLLGVLHLFLRTLISYESDTECRRESHRAGTPRRPLATQDSQYSLSGVARSIYDSGSGQEFCALIRRLRPVDAGRRFDRDEMNER